jgi:predicted restriction endonuclease
VKYYLKKCKHQELGSVTNGRASRGRYLLISKDERILKMFPPLSGDKKNERSVIPILPLYSGKKVYCKFIYHNSKIVSPANVNGRNEYRLYLNKELGNEQLVFEAGDIVIMRPAEIVGDDDDTQTVYLLDLIKDQSSDLYKELNYVIETSDIHRGKGGHAIYKGNITGFEDRAKIRLQWVQESVVAIDETFIKQIKQFNKSKIESLFNSILFRDFIMSGYESMCAVTGMVIKYENFMNLEAAHIKPKSHGGSYLPNNGIALCRDMHWAFDKGFFTINDNLEVTVHGSIKNKWLNSYNGKKIRIPKDPFFCPSNESMEYHRKNVYGIFLKSGKL